MLSEIGEARKMQAQARLKVISGAEVIGIRTDLWFIHTDGCDCKFAMVAAPTMITKQAQNGLRSDNQYGRRWAIFMYHPSLRVDLLSDDFERFLCSVTVHLIHSDNSAPRRAQADDDHHPSSRDPLQHSLLPNLLSLTNPPGCSAPFCWNSTIINGERVSTDLR